MAKHISGITEQMIFDLYNSAFMFTNSRTPRRYDWAKDNFKKMYEDFNIDVFGFYVE